MQAKAGQHFSEFSEEQKDKIEQFMLETLPHGSGIDCKWEFEWHNNGKLKASNSFHCMDEHGYYCGYADFSLTFGVLKSLVAYRLQFHGEQAHAKNKKYMLRDYLEDTLTYALDEHRGKSLFSIAIGA